MKDEILIKIKNVDFFYNKGKEIENHVLKDINIEIKKGEYASFLGTSGSGKSTLLYVVSGVDKPTSGQVLINDQDLTSFNHKQAAQFRQSGIGFVFQNFNLIPSLNVLDNVALPMTFTGVSVSKRKERANMLLKRLEIGHLANRFPFELSGGQQQRVGIARALSNDPPLILADEPIGNLDTENANIVLDILKDINKKEGKTVVIVTHEPWSLRDVTKVFKIQDGRIVEIEDRTSESSHETINKKVSIDTQAKMLTEFLFLGYSHSQMVRVEEFIALRLSNKISPEELTGKLDLSFKNFGAGLWKSKAMKMSEQIEVFLDERKNIISLCNSPVDKLDQDTVIKLEKVTKWMLGDIKNSLNNDKYIKLTKLVSERANSIISREKFIEELNTSIHEGGLGINIQSVLKISERMDILLGETV